MHLPWIRRLAVIHQLAVWVVGRQFVIQVGKGGVGAVVGHAGQRSGFVAGVGGGEPVVAGRQMLAHGELQALLPGRLLPEPDDVLPGTGRNRVPARLVLGLPQIETVVVHCHAAEILCTGFLVEGDEVVGVESIGLPRGDYVLEAELRGVAVGSDVILVLLVPLDVHIAGVPVAVLGGGLRAPMRPDAELGVAKPCRDLPFPE